MKNEIFKTIEAAASQSGAMEPETISKNAASLKSHTSRGNFLRKAGLSLRAVMILFIIIAGMTFAPFSVSAQSNSSFTAKNFSSKDAKELAKKQQSIAIVPVAVSIAVRANEKITAEQLLEQQRTESVNFQREIYSWMLRRKMKTSFTLGIQEIEVTNSKLKEAGYPEKGMTNAQLCEMLGVDGIILSSFNLSKPVSQGAALAVGLALGVGLKTNQIQATLSAFDNSKRDIIWMYGNKLSGGFGSTTTTIVDQLMKKASKKMPYFKK